MALIISQVLHSIFYQIHVFIPAKLYPLHFCKMCIFFFLSNPKFSPSHEVLWSLEWFMCVSKSKYVLCVICSTVVCSFKVIWRQKDKPHVDKVQITTLIVIPLFMCFKSAKHHVMNYLASKQQGVYMRSVVHGKCGIMRVINYLYGQNQSFTAELIYLSTCHQEFSFSALTLSFSPTPVFSSFPFSMCGSYQVLLGSALAEIVKTIKPFYWFSFLPFQKIERALWGCPNQH